MMDIKGHTTDSAKKLLTSKALVLMREKKISQEQFKFFVAQKTKIATNFLRLIEIGIEKSRLIEDEELARILQKNLSDERGVDEQGIIHSDQSHNSWRSEFLSALGISTNLLIDLPLLRETMFHAEVFQKLEYEGDALSVAGALLMTERVVPLEYRAVQISRDYLFPEVFVDSRDDTMNQKAIKARARRYIDDHIVHDAKEHFPALLKALEKYENDYEAKTKITYGINIIEEARLTFFNAIGTVWESEFAARQTIQ